MYFVPMYLLFLYWLKFIPTKSQETNNMPKYHLKFIKISFCYNEFKNLDTNNNTLKCVFLMFCVDCIIS